MHFVFKNRRSRLDRWPFYKPQFLILNIAVGGVVGGAVDVCLMSMEVEHVRVYRTRAS